MFRISLLHSFIIFILPLLLSSPLDVGSFFKEACKSPSRLSLHCRVLPTTNWGKCGGGGESTGGQNPVNILQQYFNTDHSQNIAFPNYLLSEERGCKNKLSEIRLKFHFEGYLGSFLIKLKTKSQHIGRFYILSSSSKHIN